MALSKKELKERWVEKDGPERLAAVVKALQDKEDPWPILEGFTGVVEIRGGGDLRGANLREAHLEGANLREAHFEGADLFLAHLNGASLGSAHLEGTDIGGSSLKGADLTLAHLEGASFMGSQVDGANIFVPFVDSKTDFRGSNLETALVFTETKNRLKYNIRRMNWEEWYLEHRFFKWPVKVFWWLTNYGTDQKNLLRTFFLVAFGFALIYWYSPEIIHGLSTEEVPSFPRLFVLARAMYFSIVTMTTLGFGDMYAAPTNLLAHGLLTLQVLLGYSFLGALITRLGILFLAEGPTDIKKD